MLSKRDRILTSIELALGFPPRKEEGLHPSMEKFPAWTSHPSTLEAFRGELEALSCRVHQVQDQAEARECIRQILQEHEVKKAVRWDHPLLQALELDSLLEEAGVEIGEGDPFIPVCASADIGITAADAFLAESGTLVVRADRRQPRAVSLLPPIHLAVVTPGEHLASVSDLPSRVRSWMTDKGRLPSAIHLISGPSRTADIELTLVLGAHGPKVLHIVLLEAESKPSGGEG